MPAVRSIDDLVALNADHQGVPLFNTVATDSQGNVWYADTAATPNLSAEAEQLYIGKLFGDPLTQIAYEQGFVLLDGSDSRFRWEIQPDARDPGLVAFPELPQVARSDYVFNANDSFWVPSAEFTLTGPYSIMNGEQGTALTMRTRQNVAVLGNANSMGAAGTDGQFDADEVRTAAFDNTARTAVLLRDSAVAACTASPLVEVAELTAADGTVDLPAATVDLTAACGILAAWDGVYDLDRSGPDDLARDDGPVRRHRLRASRAHSSTTISTRPTRRPHRRCPLPTDADAPGHGPRRADHHRGGLRPRHDAGCGPVLRALRDPHPDPWRKRPRGSDQRGHVDQLVDVE